mmetsp:Transcript_41655/g.103650  ORF Transcript_41655/g.103650 Transcript_41655/m.103650 type:complete len:99 (-) Transcript_41655:783-1079(-)
MFRAPKSIDLRAIKSSVWTSRERKSRLLTPMLAKMSLIGWHGTRDPVVERDFMQASLFSGDAVVERHASVNVFGTWMCLWLGQMPPQKWRDRGRFNGR